MDIISEIKNQFPDMWIKPGVEFDGNANRIAWSGEGANINGIPAFDSYSFETDPNENSYVMMVKKELADFCEERGYYWESYDPGTYFLYVI